MRANGATELNRTQGRQLFDRAANQRLGISGDEFLRRHEAGTLDRSNQAVLDVEILIPFAR